MSGKTLRLGEQVALNHVSIEELKKENVELKEQLKQTNDLIAFFKEHLEQNHKSINQLVGLIDKMKADIQLIKEEITITENKNI